jgi:4a-hydroxytetrahydrobiopterin dehydratase
MTALARNAGEAVDFREEIPMASLAEKTCVPCRGGVPPMTGKELERMLKLVPGWKAVDDHHITRIFTFPDFKQALEFVNRVGAVAEQQGHHPDTLLTWGKVEITLWTHKINGLSESDFIMAAKIDRLEKDRPQSAA